MVIEYNRIPLIDGDCLIYEVGFSSQQMIDGVVVPASWEFAQDLLEKKIKLICEEAGGTQPPILFLTNNRFISKQLNKKRKFVGEKEKPFIENFRVEKAKTQEYKGNRKADKPFHYKNLITHMLAAYDCRVSEDGLEADDMLCITQMEYAKNYGVRVPYHKGFFYLDYEDWIKYSNTTFIKESKGYLVNDTGKGETRKVWLLHRDILNNPEGVVDHINGITEDCRKYNLRVCSIKENVRNSKPQLGTSKFKGVHWDKEKSKWAASIKVDGKSLYLGRFEFEEGAALAYDQAAEKYFGEFARLNFKTPYVKPYTETIICSRDKDVRQCPLLHYSWECGGAASIGPLLVDELGFLSNGNEGKKDAKGKPKPFKIFGTGAKFFYAQLLMGDNVDNIPGVRKKGQAFAYKLLHDAETVRQCYELVAEVYVKDLGDEWKTKIKEMADLLYMVREFNEDGSPKLWLPPPRD